MENQDLDFPVLENPCSSIKSLRQVRKKFLGIPSSPVRLHWLWFGFLGEILCEEQGSTGCAVCR